MALSWNEIKQRATKFSNEWQDAFNEDADAKSFVDAFFDVFGIPRRKVGTFEHRVRKIDDKNGYIDFLWKGTMLIEMKSKGKDLDKAFTQATNYTNTLQTHELPKYILTCDFGSFRLKDLEENTTVEFKLENFVKNVQHFGFIAGYQKRTYKEQDPVNIKAAELMGNLHDELEGIGYTGHPLEVYLVRILFCLFAEDTTIFNKQQFQDYIEQRTNIDGSDLASKIQELFQVLNTPADKRFKNIDEQLAAFPYVNGKLFEEMLPVASFDSKMRQALLNCCYLDWSKISPAIFGSMFQSVMNPKERRNLGAHYTSEKNILKLIKPLFLDELWQEFESIKANKNKLPEFHKKISQLKFLDPACGCGNFLVITYRELRLLELAILRAQYNNQIATSIESIIWLEVDMMYGIEYEEFPARIAEVAMWLVDHQMNMAISNEFGQYFVRLPLKKAANIVHGNALRLDWHTFESEDATASLQADSIEVRQVVGEPPVPYRLELKSSNIIYHPTRIVRQADAAPYNYIIGNPPFIGRQYQSAQQKKDIEQIFKNVNGAGVLDYVSCWYVKAAEYLQKYNKFIKGVSGIKCAFVSTNSICQGEQVSILWNTLLKRYHIKIHFAHRTFSWRNEATANAAVHVVIVGFSNFDVAEKFIYEYEDIKGEPHEVKVKNINPYLVAASDVVVVKRRETICKSPAMAFGSMPNDGGYLVIEDQDLDTFLKKEPKAKKFIHPFIGSQEFLNNEKRWCLWLLDVKPEEFRNLPEVMKRIELVKINRLKSAREATKKLAQTPFLFGEIRQPQFDYLVVPEVSSERRKYIPIGFVKKEVISSNKNYTIDSGNLYHLGVLSSVMHMAWTKQISGRLKSDFQYSTGIVYNNYPWPFEPSDKQVKAIETAAQKVLDARAQFPDSSLADLYDPLTMPPALVKAHNELDKAVDLAYRPQPFTSEAKRMEFLFELYEKYTADLFTKEKPKKPVKKRTAKAEE